MKIRAVFIIYRLGDFNGRVNNSVFGCECDVVGCERAIATVHVPCFHPDAIGIGFLNNTDGGGCSGWGFTAGHHADQLN